MTEQREAEALILDEDGKPVAILVFASVEARDLALQGDNVHLKLPPGTLAGDPPSTSR